MNMFSNEHFPELPRVMPCTRKVKICSSLNLGSLDCALVVRRLNIRLLLNGT